MEKLQARGEETAMSMDTLPYDEILRKLAPCGLNCRKCLFNAGGEIKELSAGLKERLGNFAPYAARFSEHEPAFTGYREFSRLLDFFSTGDCRGCREGGCRFPGCNVNSCTSEKNIDFCFQCGEFPCEKSNLMGPLKERWIKMNSRMKESGVEKYYMETKDEPRYV